MSAITKRDSIKKGQYVVILTSDGAEVSGKIKKIYSTQDHPGGIKVGLITGDVGRVIDIPTLADLQKEQFIYFNTFFQLRPCYSLRRKDPSEWVLLKRQTKQGPEAWLALTTQPNEVALQLPESVYWAPLRATQSFEQLFGGLGPHGVVIDGSRYLTWDKFVELERYYRAMP